MTVALSAPYKYSYLLTYLLTSREHVVMPILRFLGLSVLARVRSRHATDGQTDRHQPSSEMCVQCVCHFDSRHTANDVSISLWSMKRIVIGSARHCSTVRSLASTDQRSQNNVLPWYIDSLQMAWCTGLKPGLLNPGCWGHVSRLMQATFSRRCNAVCDIAHSLSHIAFHAMCDSVSSCRRVHSWRPLTLSSI